MSIDIRRRELMVLGMASIAVVSLPAGAASGPSFFGLTDRERGTLNAFADLLVPGAARADAAAFVDAMLKQSFRMLAYEMLGSIIPAREFYPAALRALEYFSQRTAGLTVSQLSKEGGPRLVATLLSSEPSGWSGPPAALTYWAIRNDALDATYGSEAAYSALGVPYMPHIRPPRQW